MTRWLDISEKYEGLSEVAGSRSNPTILHWLQVEGKGGKGVKDDATPWCGATMAGVFTECGMGDILPENPLGAREWLKVGEKLDAPRVGAIVVFPRPPHSWSGHVGLVTKFDDKTLWVRGGNQGDKVCVSTFPRKAALGFRWPLASKTSAELAKQSRIAAAARQQQRDQTIGLGAGGSGSAQAATPAVDPTPGVATPPPTTGVREGIDGALTDVSWAKGIFGSITDFASFVGLHWHWVALAIGGYFLLRVLWNGHRIKLWRTEDHNEGYTQ
jgi:uncharacterized protein (TIGR02594 family)